MHTADNREIIGSNPIIPIPHKEDVYFIIIKYMADSDSSTITISTILYEGLLQDRAILQALYAGGVDNWDWYDESLREFYKEEDEDEEDDE